LNVEAQIAFSAAGKSSPRRFLGLSGHSPMGRAGAARSPKSRAENSASVVARAPMRNAAHLIVGFLIIPACLAAGYSTARQIAQCGDFWQSIIFFFIGFAAYLAFFLAFRKPFRTYLVGHELTHALWVFLFRGKVHEIRLSGRGGQIKATKKNTLIALTPYFFPLYTIILMAAYFVASRWINFGYSYRFVVFAIGFTWSFHLLLNIFVLRRGQEDLRVSGKFLSLVTIFLLNLVVLGLIMVFVSKGMTLKSYLSGLTRDVVSFYTGIGRAMGGCSAPQSRSVRLFCQDWAWFPVRPFALTLWQAREEAQGVSSLLSREGTKSRRIRLKRCGAALRGFLFVPESQVPARSFDGCG